uniref:HAT C-terminal dimerisation domain-containing protein n=1 Tax=Amphimedon queenslandica TaxID=400682 RepID=A0A1X7U553_AMPQE
MLPIYLVDKPCLQEMISVINPIRLAIPCLYEDTRHNLESKLASSSTKCIVLFLSTSDLWSSHTSDPFLVYTIHYIDSNWTMQTRCLKALYLPQDHTGENIEEALGLILEDWKLSSQKQVAITTDNGSNIKLVCNLLH